MSFSLSVYLSVFCPRSVLSLALIAASNEGAHLLQKVGEEVEENPPETSNDEGGVGGERRGARQRVLVSAAPT